MYVFLHGCDSTDELAQAYEEQLGQARAIQAQLQLCEEELEARTQDLTRYAAENRNIEVPLTAQSPFLCGYML